MKNNTIKFILSSVSYGVLALGIAGFVTTSLASCPPGRPPPCPVSGAAKPHASQPVGVHQSATRGYGRKAVSDAASSVQHNYGFDRLHQTHKKNKAKK